MNKNKVFFYSSGKGKTHVQYIRKLGKRTTRLLRKLQQQRIIKKIKNAGIAGRR